MKYYHNIAFLLLFPKIFLASTDIPYKNIFILEIVRHGARIPGERLNADWNKMASGQLSPQGMRQSFLLGHNRRYEYIIQQKFLDADYNIAQINIRSSNSNRTLMSAQSFFLGLYPRTPKERINMSELVNIFPPLKSNLESDLIEKMGEMPLPNYLNLPPIHSQPNEMNPFHTASCPKGDKLKKEEFKSSVEVSGILYKYKEELEEIFSILNIDENPVMNRKKVFKICRGIDMGIFHGIKLGLSEELANIAIQIFGELYPFYRGFNSEYLGIYSGLGVWQIIYTLDDAIRLYRDTEEGNHNNRKLYDYISTHDSALSPIVTYFGIKLHKPLPFAAHLVFKLYLLEHQSEIYIKTYYNDQEIHIIEDSNIPFSYSKFRMYLVKNLIEYGEILRICGSK